MLGARGPWAAPRHSPGTLRAWEGGKAKGRQACSEKLQAAELGEISVDHFPREVVAFLPAAEARAGSGIWRLLSSREHQAVAR